MPEPKATVLQTYAAGCLLPWVATQVGAVLARIGEASRQ